MSLENPSKRKKLIIIIIILKNREEGERGSAGMVHYNKETGRLTESVF
jgi:hypothetical protein